MPTIIEDFREGIGTFYFLENGKMIPFDGITEAKIDMSEETHANPMLAKIPRGASITFTVKPRISHGKFKKWKKVVKRENNRRYRYIRWLKRTNERLRRAELKGEKHVAFSRKYLNEIDRYCKMLELQGRSVIREENVFGSR